ncbi:hypothetical protein MLD38_000937 [Melastoma candidum]|uniref:Uncharacterized protein n=1 Tax=Melastoma candidum TaxID=119954 RepID=A0ACB9SCK8_9MYRT|nr:hypothetical protein MLD38_000937 [Melastoma candidum]
MDSPTQSPWFNSFFSLFLFFTFLLFIPTLGQSDNYIIHMEPTFMPKIYSNHHSWYLATVSSLQQKSSSNSRFMKNRGYSPESKLLYTYTEAIHGFSANLSPDELEALLTTPGFISYHLDASVKVDTTHSTGFLGLSADSGVWPASDYGMEVIIGLVDTGVWPESKSFDDDGFGGIPSTWKGKCEAGTQFEPSMCNKKLIGARYFNKGLIAKNPHLNISMNSTRDTAGHGTHTSTTAAGSAVKGASYFGYGSGTAVGIAPMARVAMYKALWDEGAQLSDIIAAIDQAIADGVDVLSLSLGLDGLQLYQDPIAIATFAAVEKGIFVSTSAGNEGPYAESLHNGIPWVITVAAGEMDRDFGCTIGLGGGSSLYGSTLFPGDLYLPKSPIVFMDACNDTVKLRKVGRKVVVCEDKGDMLDNQIYEIYTADVSGGIFITNSSILEFYAGSPFPAIFVNPKDGETIKEYIQTSTDPTAKVEFRRTVYNYRPAPSVAVYSSRGPSPSCPFVLKPDILAPGTEILAAWPQNVPVTLVNSSQLYSDFNLLSGTSMACPHIAGVGALIRDIHPEWSPATIRSALITTAYSTDSTNSPIKDKGSNREPANPLAMGAGHVDPNKAADPGLVYDVTSQDYVNLMCALNFTENQIKIITKSSSNDCSRPSLDLNYPSFIAFFSANSSETPPPREFFRTVTNVGDATSTYTAKFTPMEGFEISVVPDKLSFHEKYEKLSYKLTIRGPKQMTDAVVFGHLSWVDSDMKHVVTSPIVATTYRSELIP